MGWCRGRWPPVRARDAGGRRVSPVGYGTSCDDQAGLPSGSATAGWRREVRGVEPACVRAATRSPSSSSTSRRRRARRGPTRPLAPMAPDPGAARAGDVHTDDHGRRCVLGVRDDAVAPAADLVSEHPKPPRPSHADGAFCDDAARLSVRVGDGRHLDGEPAGGDADLQRRVVEGVARGVVGRRRTVPRRPGRWHGRRDVRRPAGSKRASRCPPRRRL